MKRRFLYLSAALAFVFIVNIVTHATGPTVPGKRLFLWRIKSTSSTVYLLGSIHVAKPKMYPLDPRIETAFQETSVLVVEADVSPDNASGIYDYAENPNKNRGFLDFAGAYAIQRHGDMIVERIEGSYSNVVGLPVERLRASLEKLGMF